MSVPTLLSLPLSPSRVCVYQKNEDIFKSGWDFSDNKGKKTPDLKRKRPKRAPIYF